MGDPPGLSLSTVALTAAAVAVGVGVSAVVTAAGVSYLLGHRRRGDEYEEEGGSEFSAQWDQPATHRPRRLQHRGMGHQSSDSLDDSEGGPDGSPLTPDAIAMVRSFIAKVRDNKAATPSLYKLIESQAGSATNIAEFITTVVEGRQQERFFVAAQGILSEESVRSRIERSKTRVHPEDVVEALRSIVSQSEMSNKRRVLLDLDKMLTS